MAEKIKMENGTLKVPENPIIPFVEALNLRRFGNIFGRRAR